MFRRLFKNKSHFHSFLQPFIQCSEEKQSITESVSCCLSIRKAEEVLEYIFSSICSVGLN